MTTSLFEPEKTEMNGLRLPPYAREDRLSYFWATAYENTLRQVHWDEMAEYIERVIPLTAKHFKYNPKDPAKTFIAETLFKLSNTMIVYAGEQASRRYTYFTLLLSGALGHGRALEKLKKNNLRMRTPEQIIEILGVYFKNKRATRERS